MLRASKAGIVATSKAKTIFGSPVTQVLAEQVAELQATRDNNNSSKGARVLLMASKSLQESTNVISSVVDTLGSSLGALYTGMRPHSPRQDVLDAARMAREADCNTIVTVGGGSLTDAGKAVTLCLEQGIDTIEGFEPYKLRESFVETPNYHHTGKVPQIAVPTTLSGGEFTSIAGVTDDRAGKQGYVHPALQPDVVIFDPAITQHTPAWLWFSTGIRAVDHCIEGLCSINGNYFTDGYATTGLELLVDGLRGVQRDASDMDARLKCQVGCWKACAIVPMGVHFGASHAIGHVLGGTANVPHGYTSCVMLPYVLEHNNDVIGPELSTKIARILAHGGGNNNNSTVRSAAIELHEFIQSLGLPRTLPEVNVDESQLQAIAEGSMLDPWLGTNPKKIDSPAQVLEILRKAHAGTMAA